METTKINRVNYHMHSQNSDGRDSVQELVNKLEREKVEYAALTDHDSIGGVDEFISCCKEKNIIGLTGIEVSTKIDITMFGEDVTAHIIGLNFDLNEYKNRNEKFMYSRDKKIREAIILMKNSGYDLNKSFDDKKHLRVRDLANAYLCEKNSFKNVKEVYLIFTYLGIVFPNMGLKDVIKDIKGAGGVVIAAHPFDLIIKRKEEFTKKRLGKEEVKKLIKYLMANGIDGIETNYTNYEKEDRDFLNSIAQNNNLIKSTGTDYHGKRLNEKLYSCIDREDNNKILGGN